MITGNQASVEQIQIHHLNNAAAITRQDKAIILLHSEFERVGNPFLFEGNEFINVASKAVFNDEIATDVNRLETLGTDLYDTYKLHRLVEGTEVYGIQ